MKKGQRPQQHPRRVRTRKGKKTVIVNRGIKRTYNRKQRSLMPYVVESRNKEIAQKNFEENFKLLKNPDQDTLRILKTSGFKIPKTKTHSTFKRAQLTPKEFATYKALAKKARNKGYNIPAINQTNGPLIIDEINIPETSRTEAYNLPDEDIFGNPIHLVLVDDDALTQDKIKAFAHELGHVHQWENNVKPHTELNADKIAAHILGTTIEDIQLTQHVKDNLLRLERKRHMVK